jgi:hypothetical protein
VHAERVPCERRRGDSAGGHKDRRTRAKVKRVHEGRGPLQAGRRGHKNKGQRDRGACETLQRAQNKVKLMILSNFVLIISLVLVLVSLIV